VISSDLLEVKPKFVILIVGKNSANYNFLRKVMDYSWVKKDARIYYVYGNGSLGEGKRRVEGLYKFNNFKSSGNANIYEITSVIKNNILVNSVQGWDEILPNTISAMQYLCNNVDFDFLVRTNQSTYWNLTRLEKLLTTLPLRKLYAGHNMIVKDMHFVSGTGIILSKDLVEQIIASQDLIDSELIDDVSIGRFMESIKVQPISIPRPSITFLFKKCRFSANIEILGSKQRIRFRDAVSSYASIRCKDSEHIIFGKDIRRDFIIALAVNFHHTWLRLIRGRTKL
jgi:hypothetical protein